MKLKLIKPLLKRGQTFRTLTLPSLAAITPADIEIVTQDGRFQDINFDEKADLVGITCETQKATVAYKIADEYRKRGIKVVLGGTHATLNPAEASRHADAIVIGEAEQVWQKLLTDFKDHKLKKFYKGPLADLSKLPLPRVDLLRTKNCIGIYPIEATRGCRNACNFCLTKEMHGNVLRKRPIGNVLGQISAADSRYLIFIDDNLAQDRAYAKELFRQMQGFNKKFFFQTNLATAQDKELLGLASKAGCVGVFLGLESVYTANLIRAKKGFNKLRAVKGWINRFHDYGMIVDTGVVFGFDNDDKAVFKRTLDFLIDIDADVAAINHLIPFPGTALFKQLNNEGRIIEHDYSKYTGAHIIVKPKLMSVSEMVDGYKWLNRQFCSTSAIFRRLFSSGLRVKRMPIYMVGNFAHKFKAGV